jgi:hypothetical protein
MDQNILLPSMAGETRSETSSRKAVFFRPGKSFGIPGSPPGQRNYSSATARPGRQKTSQWIGGHVPAVKLAFVEAEFART